MTLPAAPPFPLAADDQGILRVANTRVPLDNLIHEFLRGATAAEIAAFYPSVALDDVYTLIGYYLRHRAGLDEYLQKNRTATDAAIDEGRQQQAGLRERLLARMKHVENSGGALTPLGWQLELADPTAE